MQNAENFIRLDLYPLHEEKNPLRTQLLSNFKKQMQEEGVAVLPNFLSESGLKNLVQESEQLAGEAFHSTVKGNAYLEDVPSDLPTDHPMRLEDGIPRTRARGLG